MKAPNRIISPHEMSIILSEIGELPHDSVWEEVCAELHDAGYTGIEIEQVHREWQRNQPPPSERTPITTDVSVFGEGTFTVVPNFDPGTIDRRGINLELWHEFIPRLDGRGRNDFPAALLVSSEEADEIAEAIRRAAAQTRGENPDVRTSEQRDRHHAWLVENLGEDGDHAWMYAAVMDAFSKGDSGAVRESIVAALVAIYEKLKDVTIQEMMYDLTGDVLGLADDLELDRA